MIYLDYAASTPISESAKEVLFKSFEKDFANPSAGHKLGKNLQKKIEKCRQEFLVGLNATTRDRFIFTSSATESNNTVLWGLDLQEGDEIIFCEGDHASLTKPVKSLFERKKIKQIVLPLKAAGEVDIEALKNVITDKTRAVFTSLVNNQSGNLQDVKKIIEVVKECNPQIHFHLDAVQGIGKVPFSIRECKVDSMSISGHKLYGPKGIAGLYLKEGVDIFPMLHGGGQEDGMRSSTQPAPLIFSFTDAFKESIKELDKRLAYVTELYQQAIEQIKVRIPEAIFPFENAKVSPFILTFVLPKVSSDILIRHLEMHDIYVSSSSACSSKIKGKNDAYGALGIAEDLHKYVLRVSFSHTTTKEDIDIFVQKLEESYKELLGIMG